MTEKPITVMIMNRQKPLVRFFDWTMFSIIFYGPVVLNVLFLGGTWIVSILAICLTFLFISVYSTHEKEKNEGRRKRFDNRADAADWIRNWEETK